MILFVCLSHVITSAIKQADIYPAEPTEMSAEQEDQKQEEEETFHLYSLFSTRPANTLANKQHKITSTKEKREVNKTETIL